MSENLDDAGPDPIDVAVGHRIRVRRKWLGISQSNLADHLGVSFQQVQKYERGANRTSASMLVRIAEKLETTVGELVGENDRPTGDEPVRETGRAGRCPTPGGLRQRAATPTAHSDPQPDTVADRRDGGARAQARANP
uniref:Helix-turn-helix transcriptional regulator n=1 Tax=Phenylobacterium glaciei TaxID=2803784 RepID=A0A974P1F4_9CAUL|nr:helix-turn-helix transcriptional regulator [Phenylobacterium glaciei]